MITPAQALADLHTLSTFGTCTEISRYVVFYVEGLKDKKLIDELDEFIGMLNPEWTLWTGIAVLRSAYSSSPSLKNWIPYRDSVRAAHKDEPRINRLMVGLDTPYQVIDYS